MRIAAHLLVLLSIVGTSVHAQDVSAGRSLLIVQGEALIKRAPERAWLLITTEARDGKATEARRKSAEAMATVRSGLTALGLPADALRTRGYVLSPEMVYSGGRGEVRGYVVRHSLDVRVDKLDQLGDVIDSANTPRNVVIHVGSPRFELLDRDAAEVEALASAVKAARARAEAMAAAAGSALGDVVQLQQGPIAVAFPPPAPVYRSQVGAGGRGGAAADAPPPPVAPPPPRWKPALPRARSSFGRR